MSHRMEQPETETLRLARLYASLGWSVVPVTPREKLPAVKWVEFQTKPAPDSVLEGWFSVGGFGIGLVQGAAARTIVLDFDGDIGQETRARLEAENGRLPATVEALTPGGGCHCILKHPGRPVFTRKNVLPGMDVRGDGGFIVAHPSVHENGRRYEWDCDLYPGDVDVADCPDWVASLICGEVGTQDDGNGVVREIRPGVLGMTDSVVTDGREAYMRDTVLAVLREMIEEGGTPSVDALFDRAWPQYSRKVDFSRPGRGASEFRIKCAYTLRRYAAGVLPGLDGLAQAKPVPTGPAEPDGPDESTKPALDAQGADVFLTLDIAELCALPPVEWLLDGILTTDGFAVVYGPPGSLKSFLAIAWALHIASGTAWLEKPVKQCGVLYVAGEGVRGMGRRVRAWMRHNNMEGVDLPFRLLPTSVNLTDGEQVAKLVRTAKAVAEAEGCVFGLVVIDTVARALPGADENSAQDMGRFVTAVETVKTDVGGAVLGIHHSGKDVDRGPRGSSAMLGAVDTMVQIKRSEDRMTVIVEKQKDDDEGAPIRLKTKQIDIMRGLIPEQSLVLEIDGQRAAAFQNDNRETLGKIAAALGPDGRMTTRRLAEALGITSGRGIADIGNMVPLGPDYIEIEMPTGTVRLARARLSEASNSPIEVVRYDVH